ncbi:hypothetical protein PFDSM3638_07675 [Pyrococcus furiosus DSM 3638]|uniref:ABC transporter permease n=2 Tax=Pyrococcus furiosus (strain ATCC 43587 / DSM 3638 / JCM 8422 / Vc1) TaxID=186497 RepID=A0A5C0XSC6_PYRFU|nr:MULTISPECIES: hypothetical protein [Pyrococcus]AAL81648.1 hypothetical protein PF1524 [Pyrococcus furiosus DSM 3638]MDK2869030.1 hypothetical protein [Pyrococcus sp.]QEK79148.1 hypothetical protein PFDSM3638_07675 [Pyrococcus furiosus DSM 3638]
MKHILLEIESNKGLVILLIILPSLLLVITWFALSDLGEIPSEGTEFMKTVPCKEVGNVIEESSHSLMYFFDEVARSQTKALKKGIKIVFSGVFLSASLLSALILGKSISMGTIIYDIGILRNKRAIILTRLSPVLVYSLFSSLLVSIAISFLLQLYGMNIEVGVMLKLFISLFLASTWGIFFSSLISVSSREYSFSVLLSFLVVGAFLSELPGNELIFPFLDLFQWMLFPEFVELKFTSIVGLLLLGITPLVTIKIFEGGDYY